MFFLMLKDKRAVGAPPDMRTIICKHEDKQVLVDFYKSMIDGENFKHGSLLEHFAVPNGDDDPTLFADWNEEFFVDHARKAAQEGLDHYSKLVETAEQNGKEKWNNILSESFSPEALVEHFEKIKKEEMEAAAAAASKLEITEDVPVIDPILEAASEPQQEAQM